MKVVVLLALLTASECDSTKVKGQAGQTITLPCKYDRKYYGALSICWGRGEIPMNGCSNRLISSDGYRVETRASSRYELLGRLEDGDVSLTILNLTEGDAGRYGCRVEIPGWFNDEKHQFDLTVVTAPQTDTSTASHTETPSEPTAAAQTEGHMTTVTLLSSSSKVMSSSEKQALMTPLICILLGLVFVLTLGGLFIASKRLKQPNKIPQQQMVSSSAQQVQVSSTSLNLELQSSTVYNVYQMDSDGGGDGGEDGGSDGGEDGGSDGGEDGVEYEYCP